jgi:DNA repair protein RadC
MSMTDWPADERPREKLLALRHKRLTICCLTLDHVNDIYLKRLA